MTPQRPALSSLGVPRKGANKFPVSPEPRALLGLPAAPGEPEEPQSLKGGRGSEGQGGGKEVSCLGPRMDPSER